MSAFTAQKECNARQKSNLSACKLLAAHQTKTAAKNLSTVHIDRKLSKNKTFVLTLCTEAEFEKIVALYLNNN